MTWRYHKDTGAGKLFDTDDYDVTVWMDSPADCANSESYSCEGPGFGMLEEDFEKVQTALEGFQGLSPEEFVNQFSAQELKDLAKAFGINIGSAKAELTIAKKIYNSIKEKTTTGV